MKTLILSFIFLVCFMGISCGFEPQNDEEIYVKDGITYIIGHPTAEQIAESEKLRKERAWKYQISKEIDEEKAREAEVNDVYKYQRVYR